jgi:hypothetical protein
MADSLPAGAPYQSSVEATFAPAFIQAIQLPALGSWAESSVRSIHALTTSGKTSSVKVRVPPQIWSLLSGFVHRLKLVTMPKLFPPPRRDQYRSGKVLGLAVTIMPLAVTT